MQRKALSKVTVFPATNLSLQKTYWSSLTTKLHRQIWTLRKKKTIKPSMPSGNVLFLQTFGRRCVECAMHHERDVGEE